MFEYMIAYAFISVIELPRIPACYPNISITDDSPLLITYLCNARTSNNGLCAPYHS